MTLIPVRLSDFVANADVPAFDAPADAWTVAQEVNFRSGIAERVLGERPIYGNTPFNAKPLHLRNSFFAGVNYWIYGNANGIVAVDSASTHTVITDFANQPATSNAYDWTSCELNGVPVLNYLKDPVWWDRNTANAVQTLPDWPANSTCKVMRSYKNYLVALNVMDTNDYPSLVRWSDAAEPGLVPASWTPGATTDAGEFSLGGASEGITDALVLRDQLMVYKPHSVYIVQYVGGNSIMAARQLTSSAGAMSANCVAEINGKHVFIGQGDVFVTDGQSINTLLTARARNDFFARIDPTNFRQSYVVAYPLQNEVWVCVPETGYKYATLALVWNERTNKISYRSLIYGNDTTDPGCPHKASGNKAETLTGELTWASRTTNWNTDTTNWNTLATLPSVDGLVGVRLNASSGSCLVLVDAATGVDTILTGRPMVLVKQSSDLGDREHVKLVTEVWPRMTGPAGAVVNIRVGSQMEPEDGVQWGDYVPYTLGTSKKIDCKLTGRFLSVEIQSDDTRVIRVTGFDFKAQQVGTH